MKQVFLLFISLSMATLCFSQHDTIQRPPIYLRPYFECGFSFLNNDILKDKYSTNSTFNWGVGLRFGNLSRHMLLPYFQYSNSRYTTQNINMLEEKVDSTLNIQEFIVGFNIVLKRVNSNVLRAKVGYIHSLIEDDFFNNNNNGNGIQIGIGYETKIFKNSSIYIDYSYDFIKLKVAAFRDYDIQKLSLGFRL